MARSFKFVVGAAIQWPPVCTVCGSHDPPAVTTSGSAPSGLGWWGFGATVNTNDSPFVFPISTRHHITFKIARFLFFASFVFVLVVATLLIPVDDSNLPDRSTIVSLMALGVATCLVSLFWIPVRVRLSPGRPFMIIKMKEGAYSDAFAVANRDGIWDDVSRPFTS